jgi:hypothetical protein
VHQPLESTCHSCSLTMVASTCAGRNRCKDLSRNTAGWLFQSALGLE